MDLDVDPRGGLKGWIQVPGDKSISHRAVMFGAIAEGKTEIEGFLMGADCLSTVACFRALGVTIEGPERGEGSDAGRMVVHGAGPRGLCEPEDVLDAGNSGTTIRLMSGILAGQEFFSAVTGDDSIRRRPMERVVTPLRAMGARIWGRRGGTLAPLAIQGGELAPTSYSLPVASAQVKSAVLLAGLYAHGETRVTEPGASRDHTERMLAAFGAKIERGEGWATVTGSAKLQGRRVRVPGDISSAAFFLVAAAITDGSDLVIENVGFNPTRTGIIDILRRMGAEIEVLELRDESGEPVADLRVRSSELHGTVVSGEVIPRAIDEIPVVAVAAAVAEGETVIRDARELRVKETDRIATLSAELRKMGAGVTELDDGLIVRGGRRLRGVRVESHGDHRLAMALAVAGLVAEGRTSVQGAECAGVSFPGFAKLLRRI